MKWAWGGPFVISRQTRVLANSRDRKTIQMIACMVTNTSDDPMVKTNLILAPTALLDQVCLYMSFRDGRGCLLSMFPLN